MRIVKYLFIFILLITALMAGAWYYAINKVTSEINNYAGKFIPIKELGCSVYFEKAEPTGFPYKISWELSGLKTVNKKLEAVSRDPATVGYNLVTQKIFASYSGNIDAKHIKNGKKKNILIKANNHHVTASFPLSYTLFKTASSMQDPAELFNNLGVIKLSAGKFQVIDSASKKVILDKLHENATLSFVHKKHYVSVDDIMNNIPQKYNVSYSAKTNNMSTDVPILSVLPEHTSINLNAKIKTKAKKVDDVMLGMNVNADIDFENKFISTNSVNIKYISHDKKGENFHFDESTNFKLKKGTFDILFANYPKYKSAILKQNYGKYLDQEIKFIMKNRDLFRFQDLENRNYSSNINLDADTSGGKQNYKIKNMSLVSKGAGIQVAQDIQKTGDRSVTKGDLTIKHYEDIVDFTSGYVYRFGKLGFLKDKAKKLFAKTNKKFLKDISDDPKTSSKDLSYNFYVDSSNSNSAKFGNAKISSIKERYTALMLKKLLDPTSIGGDALKSIQKLIPGGDKLIGKLIPGMAGKTGDAGSGNIKKEATKAMQKEVNKIIPKDAKKVIDKIIPEGKLDKNLLNKLF